jgi:hypothetical protein
VLVQSRGERWLLDRFRQGVIGGEDPDLLSGLALALTANQQNWDAIDKAGAAIARAYWERIDDHAIPPGADPMFVIERLLTVDRGHTAMAWVGGHPEIAVPAHLMVSILRHTSTLGDGNRDADGMHQYYAVRLFERLDADPAASPQDIVALEWTYYRLLEHSERPAKGLNAALATEPQSFMFLLTSVYLPEGESAPAEVSEQAKTIAKQAYHVISNWAIIPGTKADGEIDADALRSWVAEVRDLAKQKRVVAVTESKIGAMLSTAPRKESVPWPPEAVRQIIERSRSKEMEDGFYLALRNRRGVTMRRSNDGGDQERELAAMYRLDARSAGAANVRTRALLNRIAESYESEANEEDQGAERRDW